MMWNDVLATMPLVAILRGLVPEEAEEMGATLIDAGFRCLEVPLNSPRPLESIAILQRRFGDQAMIGAGTVLSPRQVDDVAATGARMIISPNTNAGVIAATKERGMVSLPGFATASEAFAAIDAGADALKLFPANAGGPSTLAALKAVIPLDVPILPVGGIDSTTISTYRAAGADGFGLGSALFKPGVSARHLRTAAEELVQGWNRH